MKRNTDAQGDFASGVGTISAGETHVDISHGLGSKPKFVAVTCADGLEAPFQVLEASLTTTQFTVTLIGGLTLSENAKFLWSAYK